MTSALGLLLFAGAYALWLLERGAFAARNGATLDDYPAAQTALTAFLVFCGLFLVVFVEPPTPWWVGGNALCPDRRPALLALGMMAAFVVILAVPPLRASFALSPLGLREGLLLALALAAWVFLVRGLWRAHLLGRYLSVDLE